MTTYLKAFLHEYWSLQYSGVLSTVFCFCGFINSIAMFLLDKIHVENSVIFLILIISTFFIVHFATCWMFEADYQNGMLDWIVITYYPFWNIIAIKLISHIILYGIPLSVLSAGMTYIMCGIAFTKVIIPLCFCIVCCICLSCIGASMTISFPNSSIYSAFLVLPMVIPILVLTMMFFMMHINIIYLLLIMFLYCTISLYFSAILLELAVDNG